MNKDRLLTPSVTADIIRKYEIHSEMDVVPLVAEIKKAQDTETAPIVAGEIFSELEAHSIIRNEIEAAYPIVQKAKPQPTRRIRVIEIAWQALKSKYGVK